MNNDEQKLAHIGGMIAIAAFLFVGCNFYPQAQADEISKANQTETKAETQTEKQTQILPIETETSDNDEQETDDTQEDFENERIEAALLARANEIEDCTVTFYCMERRPHICGNGDGITASGAEVSAITCAVDPRVIPLGASVMIDYHDGQGLQYYIAQDTGGGVRGNHIDVAVSTHKEALNLGVKTASVYWLMEAEQ